MSLMFIEGETFFIKTVSRFYKEIDDKDLKKAVKNFIFQEQMHCSQHDKFNLFLLENGYSLKLAEVVAAVMVRPHLLLPRKIQLAMTIAYEHFTATLAAVSARHDFVFESDDANIKALWSWHALEELEHQSVAFDVYTAVGGSLWLRRMMMVYVSIHFLIFTVLNLLILIPQSKQSMTKEDFQNALKYFRDFANYCAPLYFEFFRKDFQPSLDLDLQKALDRFHSTQDDLSSGEEEVLGKTS